jgi:hypothetical protein
MFLVLEVIALSLVALAMALPLAHALELPGKMRLAKDAYLVTQPIYYPGFTIAAGFGEGGGMLATLGLLLATPGESAQLGWTLAALIALVAMHLAYWLFTHSVNKFWLKASKLEGFAGGFIKSNPLRESAPSGASDDDWRALRNRWEYSHVLRAALACISFVCLAVSVAV